MIYSYCIVEEGEAAAVRDRGAGETNEERETRGARAPTTGEYHIQSLHKHSPVRQWRIARRVIFLALHQDWPVIF